MLIDGFPLKTLPSHIFRLTAVLGNDKDPLS